ncbi:protein-tyrosine phosphatase-like protein [Butyriboletus roseoflavus]|nr:protein-tyrosine phosphatase-like protein [Butyriboletus roseoflavus]
MPRCRTKCSEGSRTEVTTVRGYKRWLGTTSSTLPLPPFVPLGSNMTWAAAPISINAVLDDKVYIGNLSAALSQDVRKKLGITHLLSVCTEHTFDPQPNAMVLPVQDSEYEDLLIHLPDACLFIETALSRSGKVLVHCVMGVSRSATVVCAYLMVSQRLSVSAAIQYIRRRRPEIRPNYGFVRQLHAFSQCRYKPSCTNGEYIAWKRRQKREVTKYLNLLTDCIPVIPDHLYLTSEFPADADAAECLLQDLGVTHLLSISSAQLPKPNLRSIFQHCFIDVPNSAREALLLELPNVCNFMGDAIVHGGRVLVQCRVELRACIVVCAYRKRHRTSPVYGFTKFISPSGIRHPRSRYIRNSSSQPSFEHFHAALPLYNATSVFYRHLELFAACNCRPTVDHPIVLAWLAEQSGSPPLKHPTKIQSITKSSGITTKHPSLTVATSTTLSNHVPSTSIDTFDMTSLNEALSRYQPASATVS